MAHQKRIRHADDQKPEILKQIQLDFHWDVKRVWSLDVPTQQMPLQELLWHFDLPYYAENGTPYVLTPWEILREPKKHPKEYERVLQADMRYAVDLMEQNGRLMILDGLHRLMCAWLEEKKMVEVRVIPRKYISEIRDDLE